eukprot:scaffold76016_cov75-Phaeocystis_antarctica.AAC.1
MHLQPSERPDGATTLLLDVLCAAACCKVASWCRHSSPTLDGSGLLVAPQLGSPTSSEGAARCWVALWAQEERPRRQARREGLWCHSQRSSKLESGRVQPAGPALELAMSDTQLLLLGELLKAVEKLQRAIGTEADAKAAAAAAAAAEAAAAATAAAA